MSGNAKVQDLISLAGINSDTNGSTCDTNVMFSLMFVLQNKTVFSNQGETMG